MVERRANNVMVVGSNPALVTFLNFYRVPRPREVILARVYWDVILNGNLINYAIIGIISLQIYLPLCIYN